MATYNANPRISVNKLGEFIVSKPRRQNRILYDQKYPADYIVAYYKEAQESIAHFIADGMEDVGSLEIMVRRLGQRPAETVYEVRRLAGNIEAIETFMNLLDEIQLKGALASIGENAPPKIRIANVDISVRPELILTSNGKGGRQLAGGIKLHFPKTNPLGEEAAGYVSAVMQMYAEANMSDRGTANGPLCPVIDIAGAAYWPGVRSIAQRRKEIEQACVHIAALWPTIKAVPHEG